MTETTLFPLMRAQIEHLRAALTGEALERERRNLEMGWFVAGECTAILTGPAAGAARAGEVTKGERVFINGRENNFSRLFRGGWVPSGALAPQTDAGSTAVASGAGPRAARPEPRPQARASRNGRAFEAGLAAEVAPDLSALAAKNSIEGRLENYCWANSARPEAGWYEPRAGAVPVAAEPGGPAGPGAVPAGARCFVVLARGRRARLLRGGWVDLARLKPLGPGLEPPPAADFRRLRGLDEAEAELSPDMSALVRARSLGTPRPSALDLAYDALDYDAPGALVGWHRLARTTDGLAAGEEVFAVAALPGGRVKLFDGGSCPRDALRPVATLARTASIAASIDKPAR